MRIANAYQRKRRTKEDKLVAYNDCLRAANCQVARDVGNEGINNTAVVHEKEREESRNQKPRQSVVF